MKFKEALPFIHEGHVATMTTKDGDVVTAELVIIDTAPKAIETYTVFCTTKVDGGFIMDDNIIAPVPAEEVFREREYLKKGVLANGVAFLARELQGSVHKKIQFHVNDVEMKGYLPIDHFNEEGWTIIDKQDVL